MRRAIDLLHHTGFVLYLLLEHLCRAEGEFKDGVSGLATAGINEYNEAGAIGWEDGYSGALVIVAAHIGDDFDPHVVLAFPAHAVVL